MADAVSMYKSNMNKLLDKEPRMYEELTVDHRVKILQSCIIAAALVNTLETES